MYEWCSHTHTHVITHETTTHSYLYRRSRPPPPITVGLSFHTNRLARFTSHTKKHVVDPHMWHTHTHTHVVQIVEQTYRSEFLPPMVRLCVFVILLLLSLCNRMAVISTETVGCCSLALWLMTAISAIDRFHTHGQISL